MEVLDWTLGVAELVLVVATVGWLLRVLIKPSREGLWRVTIASLFVAVTLAQPFGPVATETDGLPAGAEPVDEDGMHVLRALGAVPALPFVLYRRDHPLSGIAENTAQADLRARSWAWLPLLTNATTVSELCSGSVLLPCWEPDDPGSPDRRTLSLYERDDEFWAVVSNPNSERYGPGTPESFSWKLSTGVASPAGVGYWLVAGALLLAIRRRLQGQA